MISWPISEIYFKVKRQIHCKYIRVVMLESSKHQILNSQFFTFRVFKWHGFQSLWWWFTGNLFQRWKCMFALLNYSEQWKKKLSHSIIYFPTSFEHRLFFEGGIFKNCFIELLCSQDTIQTQNLIQACPKVKIYLQNVVG